MDNYISYSWNDADFSWAMANITWGEARVINKIITEKGGGRGKLEKDKKLTKEDKRVLVNLIVRIKERDDIYKVEEKKSKNPNVKVTSKDIKLFIKELKQIKLKATI
jgi:hypothetical protein